MSNAVPAGWSDGTLTDFCDINPRLAQRAEMNADTPVSFIKMEDVSNNAVVRNVRVAPYGQVSKGFTSFQNGDVLVAKITPCFENGKGGFVQGLRNGVGFGSTEFHVLRARKDSNSEFLYQFTNSEDFRLKGEANMTGSAGQRRVPTEYLKTLDVIFPPLPEQQKIAAILSSVDDVIEKTRAQIDKLKDLKTGMMQELLTKGIGHTEFKDSPVGRIPVAWKVGSLESFGIDVLDGDRGKEYPKESDFYNWEYCLFLSAKNVTKTGFKFDEKAFITKKKDDALRKGKLVRGDVVITTRGTVGNTAFYGSNIPFDHIRINSGMAIIRNKTSDMAPAFLNLLMNSPMVREQVELLAFGSAQPQLTIGIIKGLIAPKPTLDEQIAIAESIESIELQIKIKSNRLRALNHTKKALMQDLLTGKVRVKVDQKESAVA